MTFGTNVLVILVILSWVLAIEVNHQNQTDRNTGEEIREAKPDLWNSKHEHSDSNTTERRMH
tara:strand:- start:273 stop:458 length:186 start_codon:yes stop_codon:yes gene_type:complete